MTRIEKLRLGAIAACLLTILLGVASLRAQNDRAHSHSFSDTHKWSATFDDPERDKWQMPDRIIGALALRPTDLVADIGAGTGYLAGADREAPQVRYRFRARCRTEDGRASRGTGEGKRDRQSARRCRDGGFGQHSGKGRCRRSAERLSSHFGTTGLFQAPAILPEARRPCRDYRLPAGIAGRRAEALSSAHQPDRSRDDGGGLQARRFARFPAVPEFLVFRLPD